MISSVENLKIKRYIKLLQKKYRDQEKLFIIENKHLIEEAKKLNLIVEILSSTNIEGTTLVSQHIIDKLSSIKHPQNQIAICKQIEIKPLGNKAVLLDGVQDPGNVGNIIRNAVAFGFTDVIVENTDIYNPKVIQASQGAFFSINCFNIKNSNIFLSDKKETYKILGTLLDPAAHQIQDIKTPNKFIVIFGSEGTGIKKENINLIDQKIYIPILFESLNVASASAIILNKLSEVNNESR